MEAADQRGSPRTQVAVACALRRRNGRAIAAQTLNLGRGGALLRAERPLSIDETLEFELAELDRRIATPARVLRHEGHHIYALRFEQLPELMEDRLRELTAAPPAGSPLAR